MTYFALTTYILIWPTIASGVLFVLCAGLVKDIKDAKESGNSLV